MPQIRKRAPFDSYNQHSNLTSPSARIEPVPDISLFKQDISRNYGRLSKVRMDGPATLMISGRSPAPSLTGRSPVPSLPGKSPAPSMQGIIPLRLD